MEIAPDGRVFVCLQGGQLRVVKNGALLATPFLTLTPDSSGERGLLGIAFDPSFQTNNFIYVYYTATTTPRHNRVSRFTANGDVAVAGMLTVSTSDAMLVNVATVNIYFRGAIPMPSLSSRRRLAILATVCLAVFAINLDTTIVNVALPDLSRQLGATTRNLQWIVDGYNLAFAALVLTAGSIGDRFGRRPVLLAGLAGFAITSGIGALCTGAGALIGHATGNTAAGAAIGGCVSQSE